AIPVAAAPSALPSEELPSAESPPAQPSTVTSRLAEVETVTRPKGRAAKRRWPLLAGAAGAGLFVMALVCVGGVLSLWFLIGRVVPSPGSGSGGAARPTSSEPPGQ